VVPAVSPGASAAKAPHRGWSRRGIGIRLEAFAQRVTSFAGSTAAFTVAAATVIVWLLTGPLFGYSNTWQLVINTGTTIITFLMVFLIQRAQNKESRAMQLKLNELVAALDGASNRLVNVEDLTEKELEVLHRHYARLAEMAKQESDLMKSHSVDEAEVRHRAKRSRPQSEQVGSARG
jgi:low affinity Fe/Cu permease